MAPRLALLLAFAACASVRAALAAPPMAGLDHLPLAVHDLDRAEVSFRALGFAIKPGRAHENGIRTALVKFPDGSGIELVTAPSVVDELTRRYAAMLSQGEGPAFFALHVRDTPRLVAALEAAHIPYDVRTGEIPLRGLEWLFFVGDNRSPTDRPEHFAHANGATALSRVWVAPDDPAPLLRVLKAIGVTIDAQKVAVPDPANAQIAHLENGDLLILPPEHQLLPGRPIVGATFTARESRAPVRTHGLWVEFRQARRR